MTAPAPFALHALTAALRPRRRLRVSEWADAHRKLSPKASAEPGPWRTTRTPYLREIMDALSLDSPCQRVVVMKSAQMGITEAAVNWVGYIMGHVRLSKPTLIVVPTDQLLIRWNHQRLRPMVEGADDLRDLIAISKSRDGSNRLNLIDYPGGLLYLASAGSASNLKSDSICYVICDEADEYEWDVGGRGDPLGLIESRQSNFPRRKLLIFSTPTVRGASRIEGEWERSDQRHWQVACPHCGERQSLRWEHMGWDTDATHAWYTCPANGCVIEEREKPAMLATGAWVATYPERPVRGFHINALSAPLGLGYSWRELVAQWLQAQDSDERLQHFANERLGLPWEDRRTAVRADALVRRAEPYPLRSIQPGGLLITAGADTQDDRIEVQVIAWGEGGRWWVIDYAVIHGDPGKPEVWTALNDYLGRPLEGTCGQVLRIQATAIDMGGHYTEAVKAFVRGCKLPRVIAILGNRFRLDQVLGRARKTDLTIRGTPAKWGMHYYPVGTELAKDRLYHDIRTDADAAEPAARLAHFSDQLPPDYYEGLLSETWDARKRRYVPKRGITRHNEPLDTWVYAFAAAHHGELRLDRMRPLDWRRLRERYEPEGGPQPPPAPAPKPDPLVPAKPKPAMKSPPRRNNFVGNWRR
jgi:phage terminase large subunit GpA-like protein